MFQRQGNRPIQPTNRQHTHRTAGAVDQLDIVRQQGAQPVAGNGVGVAAAKLHQPILTVGLDHGGNLGRQRARGVAIAEFVHVFHAAPSASLSTASAIKASVRRASSSSSLPMA